MENTKAPDQRSDKQTEWLLRPFAGKLTPAILILGFIILLSSGLYFYDIQSIGDANTYYTATVKSMLQSWHNFFFAVAEPGGSVTVDKPPLGFWIETMFAAVLGVSGFSVILPNILSGILSVPLLYYLVKKYFGVKAGLVAALVLALTPVSLAVNRNNTIDGMLILILLFAAWAFINATESGKLGYLLLGAVWVGLGFNIKMMQAFLPLPAFYALYIFASKTRWYRKILNVLLSLAVLVFVSLLWAVAVDLIPESQRPYVGSTSDNSEMSLIFGYNGINRLVGRMGLQADHQPGQNGLTLFNGSEEANPANIPAVPPMPQAGMVPSGNPPGGMPGLGSDGQPTGGNPPPGGGPGGHDETGQVGIFRFFQLPLAKEMSWLLPFALLTLATGLFSKRLDLQNLSYEHQGILIWGGWLLTCLVFFSMAGFFHNYYLATISPALAAVVGMGIYLVERIQNRNYRLGIGFFVVSITVALAFQLYLVSQMGLDQFWIILAASLFGLGWVLSMVALIKNDFQWPIFKWAAAVLLISALIIPGIWSVKTVSASTSKSLPAAYSGDFSQQIPDPGAVQDNALLGSQVSLGDGSSTHNARREPGMDNRSGEVNQVLIDYLQNNTRDTRYLVAVPSSMLGSSLVLQTGRPVLYMGGFNGSDPVIDADGLQQLVTTGQLRYILSGGGPAGRIGEGTGVQSWVSNHCTVVPEFNQLYECQK